MQRRLSFSPSFDSNQLASDTGAGALTFGNPTGNHALGRDLTAANASRGNQQVTFNPNGDFSIYGSSGNTQQLTFNPNGDLRIWGDNNSSSLDSNNQLGFEPNQQFQSWGSGYGRELGRGAKVANEKFTPDVVPPEAPQEGGGPFPVEGPLGPAGEESETGTSNTVHADWSGKLEWNIFQVCFEKWLELREISI